MSRRIELGVFGAGAAALLFCLLGPWAGTTRVYSSYLFAYLFWIGLSLGCLAVMMLHHLVGGQWGVVTRPFLRAGARTMPVMALLFVPILLGLPSLYPWARTDGPPLPDGARQFLARPFFLARSAVYFVAWLALAFWIPRWSMRLEREEDPRLAHRLRVLCGWGLVAYGVTVFFSAVDWILSLEPGWTSTGYGMIVMTGQGLSALAASTALSGAMFRRQPVGPLHDLGNLLLAFVMLWAYVSFSQFLVIWFGDLPREIPWYLHRTGPGWGKIGIALIVVHFALPFLLLLSRRVKRNRRALTVVAGGLVAVQALDVFWRVRPTFDPERLAFHATDVVAPLAVGALWVGAFLFHFRRSPGPSIPEEAHA
jgi:hypothetical protein